jgi:transcriptional regulator with XRE-family HTH domain
VAINQLGRVLREARLRQGWSQAELARRAGVNFVTLSRIEGGATAWVGTTIIERLATALGISPIALSSSAA